MRASFIHMADTHLGFEQYGVHERFNDFSRVFWDIVDDAIERRVDFVVVAGDLFNKRAIDAMTLIHAIEGLKKLKDSNIPVIAIEGNHDRSYYRDGTSWLQFLCYQGYIVMLAPIMQDGAPVLAQWQQDTMRGSHVDLVGGHLRVYGLPWQGAATNRSIEGMVQAMTDARATEDANGIEYRLLMMHTGIEGIVARVQGLPSMANFQPLRECVDYLALGHVHKPYTFDGWIYNPGSTETCSAEESQWEPRGYYYVTIDTDNPERIIDVAAKERVHHAERLNSNRRPFVRYDLHVDGLDGPEAVYTRLERYCRGEGVKYLNAERHPVVQVHLIGTLSFDAGSLDLALMEEMVRVAFEPLYVRIANNTNDQDYVPEDSELDGRDRSAWHELERRIFEDLVARDNRYLPAKEQWSHVLGELKHMALDEETPEKIASFLRERREILLETQGTQELF